MSLCTQSKPLRMEEVMKVLCFRAKSKEKENFCFKTGHIMKANSITTR